MKYAGTAIDSLKQLLKKDLEILGAATPGPWSPVSCYPAFAVHSQGQGTDVVSGTGREYCRPIPFQHGCSEQDAYFIAHSRNHFESRVKALEIAVEALHILGRYHGGDGSITREKATDALGALSQIARCLGVGNE